MIELKIQSREHTEFIAITGPIQKVVAEEDWECGYLTAYVSHMTAGVTIQENADSDVTRDMIYALEKAVPWHDSKYRHTEGDTTVSVR